MTSKQALSEHDALCIAMLCRVELGVEDDASEEERVLFTISDRQLKRWRRLAKKQHPYLWRVVSKLDDREFEAFYREWLETAIGCTTNGETRAKFERQLGSIQHRRELRALPPRPVVRRYFNDPTKRRINAPLGSPPVGFEPRQLPR